MGNKKSKKGLVILLLLLAVVLMTIGFAAYEQTLRINGTVGIQASSWNVLYNNTAGSGNGITTTSGSETATATINTNDTNFSFDVTLAEPGDFYEATIYPHNYGTLTAYLDSITMNATCSDDSNFTNYFTYTLTYNGGTSYTASATGITGQGLAKNAQVPVKIRVEYKQPANANQLPANDVTVTVSGSLHYDSEDNG